MLSPVVRRLGVVVAVAVLQLSTACSATPATSVAAMTAHATAKQWWNQAEAAFIAGNPALLQPLYSGAALDVATAEMTSEAIKANRPRYPRPFRDSRVDLPPNGAGSWFLALIQFAPIDADGRALGIELNSPELMFAKSEGAWKVVATDLHLPSSFSFFADKETNLDAAGADARYIAPRRTLATTYVQYLGQLAQGQQPVVPFATGPTTFGQQFANLGWPLSMVSKKTLTYQVIDAVLGVYSVKPTGDSKPSEVVIFSIKRTATITPLSGCLSKPNGDTLWSPVVPPGKYSSVVEEAVAFVVATVPLDDGDASNGRKVIDVAGSSFDTSATTVPC